MKAEYDSQADAIGIRLIQVDEDRLPARGQQVHERGTVAVIAEEPVDVEILYPDLGIDDPLEVIAARFDLDLESLRAAARSALEAPDRVVTVEVAVRR